MAGSRPLQPNSSVPYSAVGIAPSRPGDGTTVWVIGFTSSAIETSHGKLRRFEAVCARIPTPLKNCARPALLRDFPSEFQTLWHKLSHTTDTAPSLQVW